MVVAGPSAGHNGGVTGSFPLWLVAIIATSIALSLPALLGGHFLDDYWYFETDFNRPEAP